MVVQNLPIVRVGESVPVSGCVGIAGGAWINGGMQQEGNVWATPREIIYNVAHLSIALPHILM